jgi:hypothetical protein
MALQSSHRSQNIRDPFVRDQRIMTVPFEFGSNFHCEIKGDMDHWIRGQVSGGRSIEVKSRSWEDYVSVVRSS